MMHSKINAIVFEVGGLWSGNQALVECHLPGASSKEGRRTNIIGFVQRIVAWVRALWTLPATTLTGAVVADHNNGCERQRSLGVGQPRAVRITGLTREMSEHRINLTPPHPGQVMKSVQELLGCDIRTGIELAAENGNHVLNLPFFDEMQTLLDLWHKAWYGYQHECGHAPTVTVSGLYGHNQWLDRCGKGRFRTHLHDTAAIKDQPMPTAACLSL